MSKVRVAVIGCGHLGKWHVDKAFNHKHSQLVAIVECSAQKAKEAKERYPSVNVVKDILEIIDQIDAGIIVTPTVGHFDLIKLLIDHNKHLFCEKPITSTLNEAKIIQKMLVGKEHLIVQVGHSERCHQVWEQKDEFSRFFKDPSFIRINRLTSFKNRACDVDVIADLMIHDLDILNFIYREKPVSVRSVGHKIRTDKWDHVTCFFEFASSKQAFLTAGRNYVKELRDFEVINASGCLYIDLLNNEYAIANSTSSEEDGHVSNFKYEKRDHLLFEQDCFYQSILENKPPFVSVADAVDALRLADVILLSLERQEKVEL